MKLIARAVWRLLKGLIYAFALLCVAVILAVIGYGNKQQ